MKDILTSIKRTPYQSLGSFMILFFTLFLSLFFFTMTSFFYGVLSYVETRPQVIAYFNVDSKEKDILQIKTNIEKTGKTTSVNYVSQKNALKIYKELNKDNPLLLEMVSENILPASIEVFAKKPIYLKEIAEFLKHQKNIDEVNYQKDIVDRLVILTTILRRVSIGILAFLILISIIVLLTTAAFKISVKREEIEVLQLIGASQGYVRKPFILEGLFFGFTSGTTAFLIFYGLFAYFNPFLSSYLSGIPRLSFYNLTGYNLYVFPPSLEYIIFSYLITVIFGMFKIG